MAKSPAPTQEEVQAAVRRLSARSAEELQVMLQQDLEAGLIPLLTPEERRVELRVAKLAVRHVPHKLARALAHLGR